MAEQKVKNADENKPKIDEEKVKSVLDEIRPMLQADGGDLTYIGMEGNKVQLKLQGACGCCPGARITLKMGVERALKQKVSSELVVEAL